eukprot:gene9810-13201_t
MSSSVRVGVRVRPLLSKEQQQNTTISAFNKSDDNQNSSLTFKGLNYNFDHVFGSDLSQYQLYSETAAPMLKGFLEGYNVTIMAYGQTGSGKTYTMGTSDFNEVGIENQGLIPRFVADLFENLNSLGNDNERLSYKAKISFLEIYGEEIYDLIGSNSTRNSRDDRALSLPVREDENGKVFVQGQTEIEVLSPESALELLCIGTRNRITASTAMNSESSRSHAVFTICLEQTVQSSTSEDDVHRMCSKLTFVDLAGSERIKRTGAEGQRLKEGIQINSGLFNLGQVINALADDVKIKNGMKSSHVPYRNSKLTHLLKDALGGNSQTLFLACVSPAESNESETHSTLNYAKQARNIQNKPVINMDKTQIEIRRLKYTVKAWMIKAVVAIFGPVNSTEINSNKFFSPSSKRKNNVGGVSDCDENQIDDLLARADVQEFIQSVNGSINEKLQGFIPTPRKIRLSGGITGFHSPPQAKRRSVLLNSHNEKIVSSLYNVNEEWAQIHTSNSASSRESVLQTLAIRLADNTSEDKLDIQETERLVLRMLDLVTKEKEQQVNINNEDITNSNTDESEVEDVDKVIQEKEEILSKLLETVKSYSVMKNDFERLVDAINTLENERQELENELNQAKKGLQESSSTDNNHSSSVEKIKERFHKVKEELRVMKEERKQKENAYVLMKKESKQCETLQKEIQKLKETKVSLTRQQRNQAQQFLKFKKDQSQKVIGLKRAEIKKQQLLNNVKSELLKKERIIGHKDREISRMSAKLKACEDHITQLLKIQNRNRSKNPNNIANNISSNLVSPAIQTNIKSLSGSLGSFKNDMEQKKQVLGPLEYDHFMSSKSMLDNIIVDKIEKSLMKQLYDNKTKYLAEMNKELVFKGNKLSELINVRKNVLNACCNQKISEKDEVSVIADDSAIYDIASYSDIQTIIRSSASSSDDFKILELLNESEKYNLIDTNVSIKQIESIIDRLVKNIDLCTADIEQLSIRFDKYNLENDNNDTWDNVGKEIITGLSITQCQLFIQDLLSEKAEALEKLKSVDEQSDLNKEINENSQRIIKELTSSIQYLKREMMIRLDAVEKQRVHDIWSLLNSQSNSNNNSNDNNKSTENSTPLLIDSNESNSSSRFKLILTHSQQLEKQYHIIMNEKEQLSSLIITKDMNISQLENLIKDLKMKLNEFENDINLSSQSDESIIINNNNNNNNNNNFKKDERYLDILIPIWNELGTLDQDRQEAISYINKSKVTAKQRIIAEAESQIISTKKEMETLRHDIDVLKQVLGESCVAHDDKNNNSNNNYDNNNKSALVIVKEFSQEKTRLLQLFESYFSPFYILKRKINDLMDSMGDDNDTMSSRLKHLIHWNPPESSPVSSFSSFELMNSAKKLHHLGLSFHEFNSWESEVRLLLIQRAEIISKIMIIRDNTVTLRDQLGIFGKNHFDMIIGNGLSALGEDVSQNTVNEAVQLIITNTNNATPRGNKQLLLAMERIQILLESVKVNRLTVSTLLIRYIDLFKSNQDITHTIGSFLYDTNIMNGILEKTNRLNELINESTRRGDQLGLFVKQDLLEVFTIIGQIHARYYHIKNELINKLMNCVQQSELSNGLLSKIKDGMSLHNAINHIISLPIHTMIPSDAMIEYDDSNEHNNNNVQYFIAYNIFEKRVLEIMEELVGMEMFIEEKWLQNIIQDLTKMYNDTKFKRRDSKDDDYYPFNRILFAQ